MATTITVNDETLTAVAFAHNDQLENMKERKYPVTEDFLASDKPLDGGELIIVEWDVGEHSVPTRIITGYERYNDAIQPTLKSGTQTPAFVAQPVMISLRDETVYAGAGKIVDVTEQRVGNVKLAMNRSIQQFVMRGAAASGSWAGLPAYADWPTLNGIDNTTGFLEAVATGTNTVHGVSKATFPAATHPGFHNLYRDVASAANTNLLNAMYGMAIEHEIRGLGMLGPSNRWYCGQTPAELLKRVLRPFEQYVGDKVDDGMRMALSFAGGKIQPIADMPTNGANTTASPMSIVLTNWGRGIRARLYPKWKPSKPTPFIEIPGTVGVRAQLFLLGGTIVAPRAGLWGLIEAAEVF